MTRLRHRHALVFPFLVLLVAVVVGGQVNTVDAHGRLVDDLTDEGIKGGTITHGTRVVRTDENGEFALGTVPRTSTFQVDALGYLRTRLATTAADEIRMKPLSLTVYVYDKGVTGDVPVKDPQARDPSNTKLLGTGNQSGQIILAPHPGKDAKFIICADGFVPQEFTAKGVLMQIKVEPHEGSGCAPLPTPSPAPGASPSASPPAPRPSPSPTGSP